MDFLLRGRFSGTHVFDQRLYWLIWLFVVIQTTAALAGLFFAPGEIMVSSEVYYFIQGSSFLFIPLLALRCNLAPKTVLKLFMGAIVIHYLFVLLQFSSPMAYGSFVEYVFNPIRPDNSLGWGQTGPSWNFVGLQRTGNYGAFAAGFGLLILGFSPMSLPGKLVKWTIVFSSVLIAVSSASRSVFIMAIVALFVFFKQSGAFSRISTYAKAITLAVIMVCIFSVEILRLENFMAIEGLVRPEVKAGSNSGKITIAQYGLQLFVQSPIVGWGHRRFADISAPLGNEWIFNSETHSYALSTLLSSGIIGSIVYMIMFVAITMALWRRKERDYAIVCGMFIGLNIYNIIYDAGALDVFACFNGIASYYALTSRDFAIEPGGPNKEIITQRKIVV